jgi:hypothetical protein
VLERREDPGGNRRDRVEAPYRRRQPEKTVLYPHIVSDGSGGAIMVWQDYRSGTNWDIYAGAVSAGGLQKTEAPTILKAGAPLWSH